MMSTDTHKGEMTLPPAKEYTFKERMDWENWTTLNNVRFTDDQIFTQAITDIKLMNLPDEDFIVRALTLLKTSTLYKKSTIQNSYKVRPNVQGTRYAIIFNNFYSLIINGGERYMYFKLGYRRVADYTGSDILFHLKKMLRKTNRRI